jgi:hypothetical protein
VPIITMISVLTSPARPVFGRMFRDIQHILGCTRRLPSNDIKADGTQKPRELDEFLSQRYGIDVSS